MNAEDLPGSSWSHVATAGHKAETSYNTRKRKLSETAHAPAEGHVGPPLPKSARKVPPLRQCIFDAV